MIATLGRLEAVQAGEANPLIDGLLRASGQPMLAEGTGQVEFAAARSVGDTWLLTAWWQELGFGKAFRRLLRNAHPSFDAERLLRLMVFNRLCDPESKLGILRWLEGALVPGVEAESVTHQRLLRTMDTLVEHAEELETVLAGLLRPLLDQDLSIVFYDLTTLRTEGESKVTDELRHYGRAKEGDIARQCWLGVVQTVKGLPIYHEVFAGNTAETTTLVPTIQRVLSRFPIRRVIVVADREWLSLDNLDELQQLRIGAQPLEFILAVPGRAMPSSLTSCRISTRNSVAQLRLRSSARCPGKASAWWWLTIPPWRWSAPQPATSRSRRLNNRPGPGPASSMGRTAVAATVAAISPMAASWRDFITPSAKPSSAASCEST